MAAVDPLGGQKYWYNGLPFPAVNNANAVVGAQKYWFNGLPVPVLFPAPASGHVMMPWLPQYRH